MTGKKRLDCSRWMSDLCEELRYMPIIYLAIPGSHNSMTYGIDSHSKIAPDADRRMRICNALAPTFMRRWARTQSICIKRQLELGVRYFDLRIAQCNGQYYYCHGLLAMEYSEPLLSLQQFLDKHPRELVILDFQHFYQMQPNDHHQLQLCLLKIFGKKMYRPIDGFLAQCSLKSCELLSKQLIIIYRHHQYNFPDYFWSNKMWPTPWPNATSCKKLQQYLNLSLQARPPSCGYVSQCIITPTGMYVAIRCLSSLRSTAIKVNRSLHSWIDSQRPGRFTCYEEPRINVILGDFVDLEDGEFCKWVINLNEKLNFNKCRC